MKFKTEAEREQFILDNLNLAYKVASKLYYQDTCFDFDDVKQECIAGLIKAIDFFDDSLGVAFSTYAYTIIHRYAIRYIQKTGYEYYYSVKKLGYKAMNFSDISNTDGEPSVADEYIDENTLYNPFYLNLESQDTICNLIEQIKTERRFNDTVYNYLNLFLQGFAQVDIARIYGVSKQVVNFSLNKVLEHIYKHHKVN